MAKHSPEVLPIGLRHSETMLVMPRHTVPGLGYGWLGFSDMPQVFATAVMIGFIEQTCIQALRPFLPEAKRTVGTHVDVSHVAPTPIGQLVTTSIELTEQVGKRLRFRVTCSDGTGIVGEGKHERAIVDFERFVQKVAQSRFGRTCIKTGHSLTGPQTAGMSQNPATPADQIGPFCS